MGTFFWTFYSLFAGINVSSDYDIATNFRDFKTYGWYTDKVKPKADSVQYDTFFDKRMKKAIETHLNAQGMTYSTTSPDVYINYNVDFSNEQRYRNNYPYGYGYYGYPFGWVPRYSNIKKVPLPLIL